MEHCNNNIEVYGISSTSGWSHDHMDVHDNVDLCSMFT